jgi:hypothetical protein
MRLEFKGFQRYFMAASAAGEKIPESKPIQIPEVKAGAEECHLTTFRDRRRRSMMVMGLYLVRNLVNIP